MRILLAGPLDVADAVYREADKYLAHDQDLVINIHFFGHEQIAKLVSRYQNQSRVTFRNFIPSESESLRAEITHQNIGYDAIVYPPDLYGFTHDVILAALEASQLRPLRVVGCPNDAVHHLSLLEEHGISIEKSSEIHGGAVAEYTLIQIGFHARKIGIFYETTGKNNAWPHDEATLSTSSLAGKTLGVIGATGKDGSAVAKLAKAMGLRVVGMGSGRLESDSKMRALGIEIAKDLDDLLGQSDFISINSAKNKTIGLVGKDQIERMRPGVIIVNPAGAEIIDKHALFADYSQEPFNRKIATLILDMPYGGRRGADTFSFDPDNAALKSLGVLFTSRMAGYTINTYTQGVEQVANAINKRFLHNPKNDNTYELNISRITEDVIELVKKAGIRALELRDAGLIVQTKEDGTPTTNADIAAEEIIRDGIKEKGYNFSITGEELGKEVDVSSNVEVIIDGIDGTRNFRDNNYGWCVSVCVRENGEAIVGIVYDPKCGETFWAAKNQGAMYSNGTVAQALRTPNTLPTDFSFSIGSFRIAGSSVIKHKIIEEIKILGGRQREWGSIALSICGTARGGLGIFVQGNATLHDYAAALLIAEEAGASISCTSSKSAGRQDVVVAHPRLFQRVKDIIASHT